MLFRTFQINEVNEVHHTQIGGKFAMNAIAAQVDQPNELKVGFRPLTFHRVFWGLVGSIVFGLYIGGAAFGAELRPGIVSVFALIGFVYMLSIVLIRQSSLLAWMIHAGLAATAIMNGKPQIAPFIMGIVLINMYLRFAPKRPPTLSLMIEASLPDNIQWQFRELTPPWKGVIERSCPVCNKPESLRFGKMYALTEDPSIGGIKDKPLAVPDPHWDDAYECTNCHRLFFQQVDDGGD